MRPPTRMRSPWPNRRRAVALLGAALVLTAGCANNFRTMRKPAPGATAPVTATSTVPTTQAAINTTPPPPEFVLTSSGFSPGGTIPATYTCDGPGTSPPLSWAAVPAATVELVLVVTDPQANDAIQWMVAGINPATAGVAAGATPTGGVVLANSQGTHAYEPLCPPAGQDHTFEFTLFPLTAPSGLTAASDPAAALARLSATDGAQSSVLTGDYHRA
jgi:phosphatidylethanolamine-binding protein (PEBP) family uncharacterized protein